MIGSGFADEAAPSCDANTDADAVECLSAVVKPPSANLASSQAPAAEAAAAPPEKPAPPLKGAALLSGA